MCVNINCVWKTLVILSIAVLAACGAGNKKDDGDGEAKPQLMESSIFLPVQEFDDKTQSYVPYIASPNPYIEQKGRIKKDAVTGYIEARRHFKKKNYKNALAALDEINKIDDGLSGPWLMRAEIAIIQDKDGEAIDHLKKAISINQENINTYIMLAKLQRESGAFINAQNTYVDALTQWPDFPEAHLNLGVLYDIYLNHPILAQKHMEAYLFLTGNKDKKVQVWLSEVRGRTGMKPAYNVNN